MNSTAEDLKTILEEDSTLAVELYPIMIGPLPHTPENVVTLIETYGGPPQLTFNKEERYEYPSVQVMLRTNDYQEGWNVLSAIKLSLHGRGQEIVDGALYTLIKCLNGPAMIGHDENQRILFVCNFTIQRRENS